MNYTVHQCLNEMICDQMKFMNNRIRKFDKQYPLNIRYSNFGYLCYEPVLSSASSGVNTSNVRVYQNMSVASRLVKMSPQTRNP